MRTKVSTACRLKFTESSAAFSNCRDFRFRLTRRWSDGPTIAFIGLNPSTADEFKLDPTITRITRRANALGFGRLVMLNLFAYRSTDPAALKQRFDAGLEIIGDQNNQTIRQEAEKAATVVCAWGVHGTLARRDRDVLRLLGGIKLHCLGKSKDGHPKHPLYLPYSVPLVPMGRAMCVEDFGL
jgi:hypothetical protein